MVGKLKNLSQIPKLLSGSVSFLIARLGVQPFRLLCLPCDYQR